MNLSKENNNSNSKYAPTWWVSFLRNMSQSNLLPLIVLLTLLFGMPAALSYRPLGVFHFASAKLAMSLVQSVGYAVALSLLTRLRRVGIYLKWIIIAITTIICFGDIFCFVQFGARFTSQHMFFILQTDHREASEFISQYLVQPKTLVAAVLVAIICIFGLLFKWLWSKVGDRLRKWATNALLCVIPVSIVANILPSVNQYFYDFLSTPLQIIRALSEIGDHSEEIAKLRITTDNFTVECVGERPKNIVLVVGESFNKHHSSLYGYYKPTSSLLQQEYDSGKLVLFNNIRTRSAATEEVVHEVFSTDIKDKGSDWSDSPLLVSVFDKGGYKVHLFDNQASRQNTSSWDFGATFFHNVDFINNSISVRNDSLFQYDGQMVQYMARHTQPDSNNNLVIVHLLGQHIPARTKFPPDFAFFSADDYPESYNRRQREEIAYYDNATRYNDYVVHSIIDFFRPYEAIVIYFSDHGEEIHDYRDHYGRTLEEPTPEIRRNIYEVPFMVWMSDSYVERFPDTALRIRDSYDRQGYNGDIAQMLMDIGALHIEQSDSCYNLIYR